jgi:hypothetical protein
VASTIMASSVFTSSKYCVKLQNREASTILYYIMLFEFLICYAVTSFIFVSCTGATAAAVIEQKENGVPF